LTFLPGLYIKGLADCQMRLLNNFGMTSISFYSGLICIVLHGVWCYYFVGVLGLGIVGIGIANVCSSTVQLVALLLFTHAQPDFQEALYIPSLRQVCQVYDYITLAIPGTLMLMLDWGAFEILVLISGLIGVNDQAACILVMNIVLLAYIFSEGFDTAACTLVGNQIGAGDLHMAR